MLDFFASLYEWFGLEPFYSTNMGDHLRGWDITCTEYITPWYAYVGWTMVILTLLSYAVQYHIIDSSKFSKKQHWWIVTLVVLLLNYLIGFTIPYNSIQSGEFCEELALNISDCIGFGLSNAIWSFILFTTITSLPFIRRFSTNCRQTTFWKP